jgi:hypothetical protein
MKLTFKQVVESASAFKELQAAKLPPRTSVDIYKLGKALDKEMEAYQALTRKLYDEHKVPKTNGQYDLTKVEDFDAVLKDLTELLETEVEIKEYSIPIELFERFDIPISTNLLISLNWLIKVEEETPKDE